MDSPGFSVATLGSSQCGQNRPCSAWHQGERWVGVDLCLRRAGHPGRHVWSGQWWLRPLLWLDGKDGAISFSRDVRGLARDIEWAWRKIVHPEQETLTVQYENGRGARFFRPGDATSSDVRAYLGELADKRVPAEVYAGRSFEDRRLCGGVKRLDGGWASWTDEGEIRRALGR